MPRRETPRVDIMPVGERRKQEMLKLIDHLRLHVDDGTVTDLFIISGGDDGWSAQALWHDPIGERELSYQFVNRLLDAFLDLFRRREVRMSKSLERRILQIMARHQLRPMDACLVACADRVGTPHVASPR